MTKIFSNKKVQNKFFVVVSVVIALVLSSFTPLCGVSFNANAAEMPTYNPETEIILKQQMTAEM